MISTKTSTDWLVPIPDLYCIDKSKSRATEMRGSPWKAHHSGQGCLFYSNRLYLSHIYLLSPEHEITT